MPVSHAASSKSDDKLDVTPEEWHRFKTALKNDEFRRHLVDYAREISDPENRRPYESEIAQLERERGNDVTWIHPSPGYVVKLSARDVAAGNTSKIFINICSSDALEVARCSAQRGGHQWSVPHCLSGPVRDCDKRGALCTVCDVIFHPDTLYMAAKNASMRQLIEKTAVEAVAGVCAVDLDVRSVKYPNLRYKGAHRAAMLRRASASDASAVSSSCVEELSEHVRRKLHVADSDVPTVAPSAERAPQYSLSYRQSASVSDAANRVPGGRCVLSQPSDSRMVVRIMLPAAGSAADLDLQVSDRQLVLTGAGYRLQLQLPQSVDELGGSAKFNVHDRTMVVELPLRSATSQKDECTRSEEVRRHDSGVVLDSENDASDQSPLSDHHSSTLDVPVSCGHPTSTMCNHTTAPPKLNAASTDCDRTPPLHQSETSCSSVKGASGGEHDVWVLPEYRLLQDNDLVHVQLIQPCLVTDSVRIVVESDHISISLKGLSPVGVYTNYRLVIVSPSLRLSSARKRTEVSGEAPTVTINKVDPCVRDLKVGVALQDLVAVDVPFDVMDHDNDIVDEVFRTSHTVDVFNANMTESDVKSSIPDPEANADTPPSGVELTHSTAKTSIDTNVIAVANPPLRRHSGALVRGILKKCSASDCSPEDDDEGMHSEPAICPSSLDPCDEHKAVHFSSHVTEKRYRSDCSIVQDRCRLERQRAKKRRQRVSRRRVFSEGDTSETDDQGAGGGSHLARPLKATVSVSSSDLESSDAELSGGSSSCGDDGRFRNMPPAIPLSKNARKKMHKLGRKHKCDVRNRLALAADD